MKRAELESQLATLQAQEEQQHHSVEQGAIGTFDPIHSILPPTDKSASGVLDLVETMFPGVERTTLVQIVENKFKLTKIDRLIASKKDGTKTHQTINIGGVDFKQGEHEGRQSQYWMSSPPKAWAAYSGILIKLARHILQGELATTLCTYTINLHVLLEKYTWEGVKSYHFQFYRK